MELKVDLDSLYSQTAAVHRAGRLAEAERGYAAILDAEPGYTQARYALGVVRAQQGRLHEALDLMGAALLATPHVPEMLFNYGNVLMRAERVPEALAIFDRALHFQPADAGILASRALAQLQLGRFDEALASFDRALALEPGNASLLQCRATALYHRGKALWDAQAIGRGFADLMQSALLSKGEARWSQSTPRQPHKTRHDEEQRAYLRGLGRNLAQDEIHIEGGARLSGLAINPANAAEAERQWRERRPQIAVIDNLLTPEALEALRRYCWGSTVWRTPYEDGYLGAFPEHGFASPLLAQLAEEFRDVFSGICGTHPLKYIWAFKYDSSLNGINIHADSAAVNVNFWLTPDEANLDPEHGGLVVWDKAAPLDWDFARFNGDIAATRAFLAANGAQPLTVPYRANRAVVFDSDLFHETDAIRFRDGYLDRRINVTLLYGNRA
jgi:tetratricopeptide (TPR) repeat protein